MSLTLTDRDRRICLVLPAVLIVAAHLVLVVRPVLRASHAQRRELRDALPADDRAARLDAATSERTRLEQALAAARGRADALRAAPPEGLRPPDPGDRAAVLAAWVRACPTAGLTLVGAAVDSQPPSLDPAFAAVGWAASTRWRFALRGSFTDVVKLLESTAAAGLPLLPVGIELRAGDTGIPSTDCVLCLRL